MNSNPQAKIRTPELDGLRGVAILLVVFYHYIFGGFSPEDTSLAAKLIHAIFPLSWSGVDLFFVLSGFLISGILMDNRNAENFFNVFYIRRICRIIPLYFLWLGLFIVLPLVFQPRHPSDWYSTVFLREIPHFPKWEYFVFLQNFYTAKTHLMGSSWLGATWSLAVEEQFYLFLPLVVWLISPKRFLGVIITLIVLVPILRIYLYLFHPTFFIYVLLPCRADALLLGVLCAYLLRDEGARSWLEKNRERLYLTLAVLFLGAAGLTVFAKGQATLKSLDSFEMISFGYSWLAMLYACLLLIVVTAKNSLITSVMSFPWLRHFGIIAYGIFLTHMAINDLVHGVCFGKESGSMTSFPEAMATLIAFLASWLLAVLSWRFIEKPIICWGHSFSYSTKIIKPTT